MKFSTWLRMLPEPATYRVDGEKCYVLSKSPKRFATIQTAIEESGGTFVEALDKNEKILRTYTIQSDEDKERDLQALASRTQLETFAKLLADAYKESHQQMAAACQMMAKLAESSTNALRAYERAIQESMRAEREELDEQRENAPSGAMSALLKIAETSVVQKAVQQTVTNGAKK